MNEQKREAVASILAAAPYYEAIADAICHRLEEQGIRCWIAPRDIQHEDWAGSIMDGLDRADVCVIIVGEHAAASPEVLKEITEAIRHLEKVKEYLTKSENQYRLANDKAQDLSIRKLTKGNPTMQEKFRQAGIDADE